MSSWISLPNTGCIKADLSLATGNISLDQCKANCLVSVEPCKAICFIDTGGVGGCYGSSVQNMQSGEYQVSPGLQSFVASFVAYTSATGAGGSPGWRVLWK